MRLYTFKREFLTYQTSYWTGHIDDYFNKNFTINCVHKMIIPVDDNLADIIDMCNETDLNNVESLNKIYNITHNNFYEFNDAEGDRYFVDVLKCQFKKFNYDEDFLSYFEAANQVYIQNNETHKQIMEYLFSINAYEDYIRYWKSRMDLHLALHRSISNLKF